MTLLSLCKRAIIDTEGSNMALKYFNNNKFYYYLLLLLFN